VSVEDSVKVESLTVSFKRGIAPDGQITRVFVRQYGSFIQMTTQQARSLAKTLLAKLGEQGT
jgi:hypothetical protein